MNLKELKAFLIDKRLLLALGILLFIEVLFQLGVYKPLLKKNSYAANINRVTEHVLGNREVLNPDILIVGTSVAFEGLSVRILNEQLKEEGWKVQSIAIRGSELVVQHRILEKYLNEFKNVKYVLHILEPGMAWVDRTETVDPTLAMLSELGNFRAISLIKEFEYTPARSNYVYLAFKSVAYRKDLGDLFINFNERIKSISRRSKNPNLNPWDYENGTIESLGPYQVSSIEDCLAKTKPDSSFPLPKESNPDHKRMIFETCSVANSVPKSSEETESTQRYFRRLQKMYELVAKRNIHIIDIFAPYSNAIRALNETGRMTVWQNGLNHALAPYQKLDQIDMQDSLGTGDNGKYCFDLIHLNRLGMENFSLALSKKLAVHLGKK
ncbi:SGNH/GDSL hydrolase family protein [Leptospira ilyithenensis]|uniref:SGNH/GDSL hydrolase family protein n=1 Tax=Leptospira ilyithenensis TaxID=2484901 RepID=A0A4R9LUK5_9LEPT|nr:SGNH/GDSL hydrolase family protein [Leptospira ilyithenensis]TGN14585.1 SGNH/GDSL hydrolase family protein [Leptospira ilyithenensis]